MTTDKRAQKARPATPTRDRILVAAAAAVRTGGPRGLSIDGVAQTAGVVRQTMYNYYRTKHALLLDVARVEGSAKLARLAGRADGMGSGATVLEAAVSLVRAARRDPFLGLLLTDDPTLGDPDEQPIGDAVRELMHAYWEPILSGLPEAHGLRGDRARSIEWLSFIHFVLVGRSVGRGHDARARALVERYVLPAITRGVGPRPRWRDELVADQQTVRT